MPSPGVRECSYEPGRALVTFEGFKVWGGQIHSINAFLTTLPQATSRAWPSADPIRPCFIDREQPAPDRLNCKERGVRSALSNVYGSAVFTRRRYDHSDGLS